MPFVPHTEKDIQEMLSVIGAPSVDALFDEIPEHLRCKKLEAIPSSALEMDITRVMHERAAKDGIALNFIGAGAYEHHIPAAVWEITTRGEYYSAYTPYQAEASQGTLQLLYEFQTMMCELTGMEISNASLYDGASSLAEALLMAVRSLGRKATGEVILPRALHPYYRQVAANLTYAQGVTLHEADYEPGNGLTTVAAVERTGIESPTAVVISQPNFFGGLEDVDALTDWAHAQGALVVAVVNPTLLAIHRPPSEWGSKGADIVVGEGQPLGAPLSSGGPYFGFLCCSKQYVRQMPGRIVGRTVDMDGKPGYTLTLQAREQHIRRSKATSNICTNQGLLVTAATIYMSLLGPEGLARVANASMANTRKLRDALCALPGVSAAMSAPFFHETVLTLDRKVAPVLERLSDEGIVGGLDISGMYPELGNALLVCATETRTDADIARYKEVLGDVLTRAKAA